MKRRFPRVQKVGDLFWSITADTYEDGVAMQELMQWISEYVDEAIRRAMNEAKKGKP